MPANDLNTLDGLRAEYRLLEEAVHHITEWICAVLDDAEELIEDEHEFRGRLLVRTRDLRAVMAERWMVG